MKKILVILCILAMAMGISGCTKTPTQPDDPKSTPSVSPTPTQTPETPATGPSMVQAIVTAIDDSFITFNEAEVITAESYADTDGISFTLPYDSTTPVPPIVEPVACILEIKAVDDEYGGIVLSAAVQGGVSCILAENSVASDSCAGVLTTIVNENADMMPAFMDADETMLELYGLASGDVLDFGGKFPLMNVQATEMFLCKVDTEHKQTVLDGLAARQTALEEQWKQYLPDQYELVCNAQIKEYNDYLIFIVHEKAEALVSVIEAKLDTI